MHRSLLALALGAAAVLAAADAAVAMPVGHVAPPGHLARPRPGPHPCRPAVRKRALECRRRRARRHRTRATGAPTTRSWAPPAQPVLRAPVPPGPAPAPATVVAAPSPVDPVPMPVAPPSAWDRPALSNPTTVQISGTNHVLVLDQHQDYLLRCPPGSLPLSAALNVWGGRNVVFEDCDLDLTAADWAAHFSDQAATLWIHDVHFGGSNLTGGIQFQEPAASVVMRDVLFDTVRGSLSTNHAELIQSWAGPGRLMIDGLTGSTTYQGLFLEPNQYYEGPPPTVFDLRHIDIDDSQGAYALWVGGVSGSPPADASGAILTWHVEDVYVTPNPARTWPGWWLWPQPSSGDPTWDNVIAGVPPGGSYVRATPAGATGVDENSSPPTLTGEQN